MLNFAPGGAVPRNIFDIVSFTNIIAIIALTLEKFFPWLIGFAQILPDELR